MNKETTGLHPFWFWNGDMKKEEIIWQIDQMAKQGINGFYIHFRQGMSTPYMSDTFFELVRTAAERAKEKGMIVHLYDEYPYPTGSAGGTVTLGHPEFWATCLEQKNYKLSGGQINLQLLEGDILDAQLMPVRGKQILWDARRDVKKFIGVVLDEFTFHEGGLTQYNRKRFFASRPIPTLAINLEEGEYLLCVSVQKEMNRFKYWGTLPDVLNPQAMKEFMNRTHRIYLEQFGTQLGKMFYSLFSDEIEPDWSNLLPVKYKERYKEELLPWLPGLINPDFPRSDQTRQRLHRLKYNLFEETFEKPISRWCSEQGIAYGGEKPSLYMKQLKYMDIPGCDPGHTKAGRLPDVLGTKIRANARTVASAAQFYNKESSLCECYHSLGWSGTLLDARIIGESLILMGIKMLVPHGYFYTTHGLTKHDAPPTFFFQMPYWHHTHILSDRIKRIQEIFEGTIILSRVFIYEPSGSLLSPPEEELYQKLLHYLAGGQIDFLMVEPGIIDEMKSDLSGDLLLVLDSQIIEQERQKSLETFKQKGGELRFISSEDDWKKLNLKPSIDLGVTGASPERLWMVTRQKSDGEKVWFLLNTGATPLKMTFPQGRIYEEISLESGSRRRICQKKIAPFESFLLCENRNLTPVNRYNEVRLNIPAKLTASPLNKNILRLDSWELALGEQKKTVTARPIINQLDDSGFAWTPDIQHYFGWKPDLEMGTLTIAYYRKVVINDRECLNDVQLVMEPGSLAGDWQIQINGGDFLDKTQLEVQDFPVRGCQAFPIESLLRKGENEISITMTVNRMDQGLINPLYLVGTFGVDRDDALVSPSVWGELQAGIFNDYRQLEIPYYSGIIHYSFDVDDEKLHQEGEKEVLLELIPPCPFQDAMEIRINDGPYTPAPWPPYRVDLQDQPVKKGKNHVEVRVYTSLIRTFEGTDFDIESHCYKDC